MLVGTHILSLGKGGRKTKGRAGACEDNVFGTETQIIVFKLRSPVIEEGIFQTKTDQQTIQRGAALGGRAKEGAVYLPRVPVKSAGYPSGFAVNKSSVKSDADPRSNGCVIIGQLEPLISPRWLGLEPGRKCQLPLGLLLG